MKQTSTAVLALIGAAQAITTVASPDAYGRNGENFLQTTANYDLSRIGIDRTEEGCGPVCSAPNWATFHWRAILGDGRVVDGTKEKGDGRPLEITVGSRQSFNCFDIAFPELRQGDHATLHCPAFYAYGGARTVSPIDDFEIPLWSDIKFEVEMLTCDVAPHKVDQAQIYTAPHTTTLQPHRCFVLRSYHEQGSGNTDFVLTNVGVDGTRQLAIEHFQTDDKDQQWFFNDEDWSIYNASYPKLRVDAAAGPNRQIVLATADGSDGQKGFDYTSNDQLMTMKGFPFNVDHETNYVTYAGNIGGVPQNWHVEYCKGEVQPRTADDLKLAPGWNAEYFFMKDAAPTADGYDLAGKTADLTQVESELNWANCDAFAGGDHPATFPKKNFAGRFTGNIRIIRGGEYLFSTVSGDGSRIQIDGDRVLDNWGEHGLRRREKLVKLDEGWHNIEVNYFAGDCTESCANLVVSYKGDDTDDQERTIKEHIYHGAAAQSIVSVPATTDSASSNAGGSATVNTGFEGQTMNINKNHVGGVTDAAIINPFLDGPMGGGGDPSPAPSTRA